MHLYTVTRMYKTHTQFLSHLSSDGIELIEVLLHVSCRGSVTRPIKRLMPSNLSLKTNMNGWLTRKYSTYWRVGIRKAVAAAATVPFSLTSMSARWVMSLTWAVWSLPTRREKLASPDRNMRLNPRLFRTPWMSTSFFSRNLGRYTCKIIFFIVYMKIPTLQHHSHHYHCNHLFFSPSSAVQDVRFSVLFSFFFFCWLSSRLLKMFFGPVISC